MAQTYSLDLDTAMMLFKGAEHELEKQIKLKLMEQAELVVEEAAKEMAKALRMQFEVHQSFRHNAPVIQLSIKDKVISESFT